MPSPLAEHPNAKARYWAKREAKNVIRGGFIVARRGDRRGDLITAHPKPIEHGTVESARAEAERLAAIHQREFVVLQEVAAVAPVGAA